MEWREGQILSFSTTHSLKETSCCMVTCDHHQILWQEDQLHQLPMRNNSVTSQLGNILQLSSAFLQNSMESTSFITQMMKIPCMHQTDGRFILITIVNDVFTSLDTFGNAWHDDSTHPAWWQYIGLLILRSPTCIIYSEASYEGLGSWSYVDLLSLGFAVKELWECMSEPDAATADGLHINVLKCWPLFWTYDLCCSFCGAWAHVWKGTYIRWWQTTLEPYIMGMVCISFSKSAGSLFGSF